QADLAADHQLAALDRRRGAALGAARRALGGRGGTGNRRLGRARRGAGLAVAAGEATGLARRLGQLRRGGLAGTPGAFALAKHRTVVLSGCLARSAGARSLQRIPYDTVGA